MTLPDETGIRFSRKRVLVGAMAASGICFVSLLIWIWYPRPRPETPIYHAGPIVNSVAFSTDRSAKYVATAMSDGRVRLWETATKRELPVKLPSRLALNDLAWNPDGELLTGGFEQHILSWNVKAGQARKLPIFAAQVVSLASRPGRGELIISLSNGQLILIDAKSSEQTVLTTGHAGIVKVVRFAPKGAVFVTGGVDGQLVWHDWLTREVTRRIAAHQHEVSSLDFSEDGQRVVSGSWDQTAKVWDGQSEQPRATLIHTAEVAHVAWMGTDIVTSSWDEQLRVWNADAASVIHQSPWKFDSMAFAVWPRKREVLGINADGAWYVVRP